MTHNADISALSVGLIGFGHWGRHCARALSGDLRSRLAAIADVDSGRRRAAAQQYPGVRVVDSARALLDDRSIPAVVVATPTTTHEDVVTAVLMKQRDVLVAKPMTQTLPAAERLASLATRYRRLLAVDFTYLHNPYVTALAHLMGRGDVGRLVAIVADWRNAGHRQHDIDVLSDLASHVFSVLSLLTGHVPSAVHVERAAGRPFTDVQLACLCRGNVNARISVSFGATPKRRLLIACGTSGALMYRADAEGECLSILEHRGPGVASVPGPAHPAWRRLPVHARNDALSHVVATFVAAVASGAKASESLRLATEIHRALAACRNPISMSRALPTRTVTNDPPKSVARDAAASRDASRTSSTISIPAIDENNLARLREEIQRWFRMCSFLASDRPERALVPAGTSALFIQVLANVHRLVRGHASPSCICLRPAGSAARSAMLPSSDIDVVLCGPSKYLREMCALRTSMLDLFTRLQLVNADVVIVSHNNSTITLPSDPIDRRIALFSTACSEEDPLAGLLLDHVALTRDELLEVLVGAWLTRLAPPPPGAEDALKYQLGGPRDTLHIIELSLLAETVIKQGDLRRQLRALRLRALRLKRHFDRVMLASYAAAAPGTLSASPTRSLVSRHVLQSADHSLRDLTQVCLIGCAPGAREMFTRLVDCAASGRGLSAREFCELVHGGTPSALVALGLFVLADWGAAPIARNLFGTSALTLFATSLNPRAPGEILEFIAALEGYESRNTRDHLLKNPSLPRSAVLRLAKDDLPFTRRRATNLLVSHRATPTDSPTHNALDDDVSRRTPIC